MLWTNTCARNRPACGHLRNPARSDRTEHVLPEAAGTLMCFVEGEDKQDAALGRGCEEGAGTQRGRPFTRRGGGWALPLQRRPAPQHPCGNGVPENNSRQGIPFPQPVPLPQGLQVRAGVRNPGLRACFCSSPSTSSHCRKRALKCIPNGHSEGATPSSLGTILVPPGTALPSRP